jgi:ABC-type transporter Mla MlaB component
MLRISEIELNGDGATLRLEGRLVGTLAAELETACEKHLSEGHQLMLDLADLAFADRAAIALLQQLRSRGVTLANCSPFLNEELKAGGLAEQVANR